MRLPHQPNNMLELPAGAALSSQLVTASDLPAFYERLDWEWWDSFLIPNGNTATSFTLFTSRQGKTPQQTNMEADGRLPRPEFFDLISVCVQPQLAGTDLTTTISPTPAANVSTILTSTLEFRVSSKFLIEPTPAWIFTAGSGIDGASTASGPATSSFRFAQNGYPTPLARWNTFVDVRIVYDESMSMTFRYDTAPSFTNDTRVFVYLAGMRYRAAQ